jgi:hypothetical protein
MFAASLCGPIKNSEEDTMLCIASVVPGIQKQRQHTHGCGLEIKNDMQRSHLLGFAFPKTAWGSIYVCAPFSFFAKGDLGDGDI